jgi:hypothetical protein
MSVAFGCSASPTGPGGACRAYPTSLTENEVQFSCTFDSAVWSCNSSSTIGYSRSSSYRSAAEFVDEARIPNRVRRTEWRSAYTGGLLGSAAATLVRYTYDDRGRLSARDASGGNDFASSVPLQDAVFDSWDSQGRPLAARIAGCGSDERVTIRYDDGRRTVTWSNGESHTVDVNGNPVEDTFVWCAFVQERSYVVLASGRVCQ